MHRWHGRGLATANGNEKRRGSVGQINLNWPRIGLARGGVRWRIFAPGGSFVNFKNWYHRNGFLKYQVSRVNYRKVIFRIFITISRVEASRFQKMEITVKSWNVESRRMLVVSKRRRRRKFIPSNPVTVSGPRWFQRFLSLEFRTKPSNVRI